LAPEPIPLFLFTEGREKFGEPLASLLADDGLEEAIAALRSFALVDQETIFDEREPTVATETIRLHRLVREIAARRYDGEARNAALCALVEVVAAVYPEGVFNDPKAWPRARRLDAIALAQVGGDAEPSNAAVKSMSALLNSLANYRQGALAAYADARPLFERALAIREKVLGPEHPDTAASLNNLAYVLRAQGDYSRARPLLERALAIYEKTLGAGHPSRALSLNNLAYVLQSQGDYSGARPLFERALAIYEKTLGAEHPNTNRVIHHLARLSLATGDTLTARSLGRTALAAHKKVLGEEHPWTLDTARALVESLGDCEEAAALRRHYGLDLSRNGTDSTMTPV
jgi:tetratricopeptide (TPR) repeat protein